jgi:hypothetical protein
MADETDLIGRLPTRRLAQDNSLATLLGRSKEL